MIDPKTTKKNFHIYSFNMSSFCIFFLFSACKPYVVVAKVVVVVAVIIIYAKNLLCEKLSLELSIINTFHSIFFRLCIEIL